MRIFLSFLFCTTVLQGMEPAGLDDLPEAAPELGGLDHGYVRPILKLAAKAIATRTQPSAGAQPSAADLITQKYQGDATTLLTNLDVLGREFTDEETIKDLAYYQKNYSTQYQSFIAKVKSIQGQPDSDQKKLQIYQLAFDFVLLARQVHNDNADSGQDAAHQLITEHTALYSAHQDQITKTKYANWRAYGAAAAGFVLTIITGLITYFEHPANNPTNASTTPAAQAKFV